MFGVKKRGDSPKRRRRPRASLERPQLDARHVELVLRAQRIVPECIGPSAVSPRQLLVQPQRETRASAHRRALVPAKDEVIALQLAALTDYLAELQTALGENGIDSDVTVTFDVDDEDDEVPKQEKDDDLFLILAIVLNLVAVLICCASWYIFMRRKRSDKKDDNVSVMTEDEFLKESPTLTWKVVVEAPTPPMEDPSVTSLYTTPSVQEPRTMVNMEVLDLSEDSKKEKEAEKDVNDCCCCGIEISLCP